QALEDQLRLRALPGLGQEEIPVVAALHAVVGRVAEEALGRRVEAGYPALAVDRHEDPGRGVDDLPRELLLALNLADALLELALEPLPVGELANDRDDLVAPARHHPRLEIAQL